MFGKSTSPTLKERANAALASLERNAYAMGMLRSRLESRISLVLSESKGGNNNNKESYQELTRVLELVKGGELILGEMSGKIESARYLEEFIMIIDSAASSVSEIKGDIERMVPVAEAALEGMHDAIAKVSLPGLLQEIEPEILAEISAAIAATKAAATAPVAVEAKQQEAEPAAAAEEEPEPVPA